MFLIRIVGRRIQKKKRAQTIPKAILKLAKNQSAQYNYTVRQTVENDNDIINNDDDIREVEDIILDDEGNVDMGLGM